MSASLTQAPVGTRRAIDWPRLAWVVGLPRLGYLVVPLAFALPPAVYVEYDLLIGKLLEHGLEKVDGAVLVPDRPGHGLSFIRPEASQRDEMH